MNNTDSKLPSEFYAQLGCYLQLCAKMEDLAGQVICKMRGIPKTSDDWEAEYCRLRCMGISKLITELNNATSELPHDSEWKYHFKILSGWLHRYLMNRHRAVHGVFSSNGSIAVKYVDKKSQRIVSYHVTVEDINASLFDTIRINQLLSEFLNP